MIREGERVVYGSEGVCRVEKIGPLEQGGQAYFTLTPLYGNGAAFVPVARESALRPALDREEAFALIRRMPELECVPEADGKGREAEYHRLLRSHDSEALACLGKSIWQHTRERAEKRRGSERETLPQAGGGAPFRGAGGGPGHPEGEGAGSHRRDPFRDGGPGRMTGFCAICPGKGRKMGKSGEFDGQSIQ